MRQAVLSGGRFELREVEPPACGPRAVLVRTAAVGVCEGEVYRYTETRREKGAPEAWMGHEGSGTVVAVGDDVGDVHVGDTVTCIGGPFAELFVAGTADLVVLPDVVDPRYALGEPVACCVHAARRFGVSLGDRVAVVGVGFMGLLCLQLARLLGAAHVCAFDPIPWRLDVARTLGADAVCDPSGGAPADVAAALGPFDVVIEAAGSPSAVDLSAELVREHGRLTLVGYHQSDGGMRTVNMKAWNYKAIDVVNGHVRDAREKRNAMRIGVDLIAAGRLRTEPLVTLYPLAEIGRAFSDLAARKQGLLKAVLVP